MKPLSLAALAALLLGACDHLSGPPSPLLPRTEGELEALVAAETRRPPPPARPPLEASAVLAAIDAAGPGALPCGTQAVAGWIQARLDRASGEAYLLFGTYHDAPGQLDAFRRLVGPAGVRGLHVAAVEQLRGDGRWRGVPDELQRGDGALLARWHDTGDRAAFAELAARHRVGDYAAWKLGYEETALDLLVSARAASLRVVGCDMPARLQEMSGATGEGRNRLREIHCVRSLPRAPALRAALLWGDAHVRPEGIGRFLPPEAAVVSIHMLGQRLGGGSLEPALAAGLVAHAPLLVPLAEGEAALVLPDATLGGTIDRVLVTADARQETGVEAQADVEGTLAIGATTSRVGREPVSVPLAPGTHTYVFVSGALRTIGAVELRPGHRVRLSFDPTTRLTGYIESAPR